MANRELLEWLGLTVPDLLVYAGLGAVAAMFFVESSAADLVLGALGVLLNAAACPLGMKRDPRVSGFTNATKKLAYPLCVLLAGCGVFLHYARLGA